MLVKIFEVYFRYRIKKVLWFIVCWGNDKGGIKEGSRVLLQMNLRVMKIVIEIGVLGE